MLAPTPASTWPITGDVTDLLAIVNDQAEVVNAQEALLHAYQVDLNAVQFPPSGTAATGIGAVTSGASTSIVVGSVVGTIVNGATVLGTTNATAPTVLGLITGTVGGNGTYLLSAAVTLTTATNLQFTPPPAASTWPIPQDPVTLNTIIADQTAIIRVQTALLQHYQQLLNDSQVAPPPTGP